ncbi:MAG TPA: tetraprenyl-beta-curcumene synthase family protein [Desulfobacteria bacterium]|nr:tetraprenyl-beta-curcumene synthase family protein [Desulfobacteria bacterium]
MSIAKPVGNPALIYQFVSEVFPAVKRELNHWKQLAAASPDSKLAEQALASINSKRFHCLGGSIYALYPGANTEAVIEFVVAYQTISDYLDNLVDSLGVCDEKAFAQLHLAMEEALDPTTGASDYYKYYPHRNDGGYLQALVNTCKRGVSKLPSLQHIQRQAVSWARLYSQLQTYKHLAVGEREQKLFTWAGQHLTAYPAINPGEFMAATGSTLGIFCLFALAFNPDLSPSQVEQVSNVYFPWVCGLHILLDYFIDLAEDHDTGQFNFVQQYQSEPEIQTRLGLFLKNSLSGVARLDYPNFHRAVVQGLLAMYLSDNKSRSENINTTAKQLLHRGGTVVLLLQLICRQLRKRKVI